MGGRLGERGRKRACAFVCALSDGEAHDLAASLYCHSMHSSHSGRRSSRGRMRRVGAPRSVGRALPIRSVAGRARYRQRGDGTARGMVLHRFSLACYALIVLRRLLCSLHVPAVTGLPSLQSLSAANFSTAFECLQSLRHVLSSLSTTRCLCALALASCRP